MRACLRGKQRGCPAIRARLLLPGPGESGKIGYPPTLLAHAAFTPTLMASNGFQRVVLWGHGEPTTDGFFENLRVGLHTLGHASHVMRLPKPLRWFIALVGAARKKIRRGGGSAHNAWTMRQAEALERELSRDEPGPRGSEAFEVRAAFSVTHPFLEEALQDWNVKSRTPPLFLSMTLVDSRLSCGHLCHGSQPPQGQILARLWDDPRFLRLTEAFLADHGPSEPGEVLILVLHGTLVADADGKPPSFHTGLEETEALAQAVRSHLLRPGAAALWKRIEIAYLNHDVGGHWTPPSLGACLNSLALERVQKVAAYPLGYLVDGLETHGEMERTLSAGTVSSVRRLPALNDDPRLVRYLAERVREARMQPAAETCCASCPRRGEARAG